MFLSCYVLYIYKYINKFYFVLGVYKDYFYPCSISLFLLLSPLFFTLLRSLLLCLLMFYRWFTLYYFSFLTSLNLLSLLFVTQLRQIGRKHLITCFMYNNMFIYYYAVFGLYLLQQYCFFTTSLVLFPDSSSTLPFFSLF